MWTFFKVLFWGFNLLVASKVIVFSLEWIDTDVNCRERYWKYILRRMFREFDDDLN